MQVAIVIVNYRTAGLTLDCLQSLACDPSRAPDWRVYLVENASPDDSADVLACAIRDNGWSGWVELIASTRNSGFAGGNNVAIDRLLAATAKDRVARPDYVLLLNPDTIIRPHAIRRLVEFLDVHPEAGIAGSRLEDPDGSPQRSSFRFPTIRGELDSALKLGFVTRLLRSRVIAPPAREQPHRTEWVAGASMLIRTAVLEQVGALDAGYFMYYEETDFCLQALQAGWECVYVPNSRVVHLVGQSSGVTDRKRSPRPLPRYWYDSRRRYFQKNHGRAYAMCVEGVWQLSHAICRAKMLLQRRANAEPIGRFRDGVRWILWPLITLQ